MPLLSGTTWPAYLLELFNKFRSEPWPRECYSTPYNMLLLYCVAGPDPVPLIFGPPLQPLGISAFNSDDFTLSLIVRDILIRPPHVLIVDIRDESQAHSTHSCSEADHQMRQLFDSVECPLPRLYGLSLLGTSLRVYVHDAITGEIKPTKSPITGHVPHNFLEGCWDINILSQKGFNVMKEIVGEIVSNILALKEQESVTVAVDGP